MHGGCWSHPSACWHCATAGPRCFWFRGTTGCCPVQKKAVTTDASLTGWGVFRVSTHPHYLSEAFSGFSLPEMLFLQRHYVLIQTDNTMMVTYKLMGGLRYFHLHLMVCRLIRWEYNRFLSGRRIFHICPTNISKFTLLSFNMLKHDKLILLLRSA